MKIRFKFPYSVLSIIADDFFARVQNQENLQVQAACPEAAGVVEFHGGRRASLGAGRTTVCFSWQEERGGYTEVQAFISTLLRIRVVRAFKDDAHLFNDVHLCQRCF